MAEDAWFDPNDPTQFQAFDTHFWEATRALRDYYAETLDVPKGSWQGVLGPGVSGSNHPRLWELLLAIVGERDLPRVRLRLKPKDQGVIVVVGLDGEDGIEQVDEIPGPDLLLKPTLPE